MDNGTPELPDAAPPAAISAVPPLRVEAYWQYLEGLDLSDAEKTMVLQTLWSMMVTFVDLGFNADPVQHILPALVHASLSGEGNELERNQARQFNAAADAKTEKEDE